jgi:GNAT superfamily N-acetyltransferase
VITIRPAELADDAALVAIDDATWNTMTTPAPPPESPRSHFTRMPVEDVIVGEQDGRVVGYVVLRNEFGDAPSHRHVLEINGLAVHPDAAGHGIGGQLVEAAVVEAARRGARKVTLRVQAATPHGNRSSIGSAQSGQGCVVGSAPAPASNSSSASTPQPGHCHHPVVFVVSMPATVNDTPVVFTHRDTSVGCRNATRVSHE